MYPLHRPTGLCAAMLVSAWAALPGHAAGDPVIGKIVNDSNSD
jgi:hypothetical protein